MKKKKVLYTEVDEDITSIFDRLKQLPQKEVALVVPKKAVLLQSLVNLKILKKKIDELKKKIVIVTTDTAGKRLASQAGIETKDKLEVKNPKLKEKKRILSETSQQPVKAVTNIVSKDDPQRIKVKKIRLKDIVHDFKSKRAAKAEDTSTPEDRAQSSALRKMNKKSIFLVCLVSIVIFTLVVYIALPGATIYIKPKSEILDQPVNVVLAEYQANQSELEQHPSYMIPFYKVKSVFEKNIFYPTTNQEFTGENATGHITIINTTDQEWTLRNKTQFQTDEGIILRINYGVKVPPQVEGERGTIRVPVTVDPYDIYGNIVGDRGNLEGNQHFFIRKITPSQQEKIWGESTDPFTGGITKFKTLVTEKDIDTATKKIELELMSSAKEYIHNYIEDRNKINNSHLVLLNDERYLEKEIIEVKYSPDVLGKEIEKFEMYAKISVQGIAFDYQQFSNIMRQELETRIHPDMRLNERSISSDSINYSIIDYNKQTDQITISATIQGVQEYIIEPTSDSGLKFSKKLKEEIMGLKREEAIAIVSNLPEVADVDISIWSFWSNTLPTIPENIAVEYKEE